MLKKIFTLSLFSAIFSISANAVVIDGVEYIIDAHERTAIVVPLEDGAKYVGEIAIPNAVTYGGRFNRVVAIDTAAFKACDELTAITLPSNVSTISYNAFSECSALKSIEISNDTTLIEEGAFSACSALESITLPGSIKQIAPLLFQNCTSLKSIEIPNSATSIGKSAFKGCAVLNEITIGTAVSRVEASAFSGCENIQIIYSNNVTPPLCINSKGTFSTSVFNNCELVVPAESIDSYKTAPVWKNFVNITSSSSVNAIDVDENAFEVARYDIYGRQLTKPTQGLNIIKLSNGKSQKVYVK